MKKIALPLILITALASSAAYAARGDNGEGQGGGGRLRPAPILVQVPYVEYETRTESVPRTVSETVYYPCSYTNAIPASLSPECNSNSTKEESFDDFASGCKIIPARNEVVNSTCSRIETKTVYDTKQVQVAVTKYRDTYQCVKPFPKLVETVERGKKITYCAPK